MTRIIDGRTYRELLRTEPHVVVDFYADWCGPCRSLAPELDKLADALEGRAQVVKVNVDDERTLADELGVRTIPTVIRFSSGLEMARSVAPRTAMQLARELGLVPAE